ncbi:MAG: hypothetical protein DRJ56_06390 [Thermoprotei archaeon]|nr:MAG: hypothetical protein DRJ56_06390 [Thermoprotei archaeon]
MINETVIIRDQYVELNQSIIIQAGGNLTLINSTLCLRGTACYISVEEGGVLNVLDSSTIAGKEEGYWLYVNGAFILQDSALHAGSLRIMTHELALLKNSTLSCRWENVWYYLLVLVVNSTNVQMVSCRMGVGELDSERAPPLLKVVNSSDVLVRNCTLYGQLQIRHSRALIESCTVRWQGPWGPYWGQPYTLLCPEPNVDVRIVNCTIIAYMYEYGGCCSLHRTSNVHLISCRVQTYYLSYGYWDRLYGLRAIRIEESTNITICDCVLALLPERPIRELGEVCESAVMYVGSSTDVLVSNCTLSLDIRARWMERGAGGMHIVDSSNTCIYNCTYNCTLMIWGLLEYYLTELIELAPEWAGACILVEGSSVSFCGCLIQRCEGCGAAIYCYDSADLSLERCTIAARPLYMLSCRECQIASNHFINSTLILRASSRLTVACNTFTNGGILLLGKELSHFLHDICGNVVNGKPIYYVVNATNYVLPDDAGQVIIVNSENVMAHGLIMGNASAAIELAFTRDTTIWNCTLMHNYLYTIMLATSCTNITICCCEIAYNYGHGIYITGPAPGIEIHFCNIYSNWGAGLLLDLTPNVVNATYNWWGSYFGPEIKRDDPEDPEEIFIRLVNYGDVLYAPWLRQPYAPDTVAPTVSITAPSAGSYVSGIVLIEVQASDNVGIARVEFYIDGELVCIDRRSPYECEWNTVNWPEGEHTVCVVAYDTSGNSAEDRVTVIVDNTSPSIVEVDFAPKRPLPFKPVSVQARVSDVLSGVAGGRLCYRVNQGRWQAIEMTVRYLGSGGEAMLYGSIPGQPKGAVVEFYVIAYDRAGNAVTSPTYIYIVGKSPPSSRGEEGLGSYGLPLLVMSGALLAAAVGLGKRLTRH